MLGPIFAQAQNVQSFFLRILKCSQLASMLSKHYFHDSSLCIHGAK